MLNLSFIKKGEEWIVKEIRSLLTFKLFFKFKYPKLAIFILCIILSYFFVTDTLLSQILGHLGDWSYLGVFFAGVLFTFGFTAPFSAGMLLLMKPENILFASIIGGFGALIGDMLIFKFVKISFTKEFKSLKKEMPFRFFKENIQKRINPKLWQYIVFALAGIFFASPLIPDEAAVTLVAGLSKIDIKLIALFSFVCNTIGIYILLSL